MTRPSRAAPYDAVVVGGGHNGLVCAAYLARAGRRTLLLERRGRVGGALETAELAPGVRVPSLADTVGRLRPAVVRDLALARHGLRLLQPEARAFAPPADRGPATGRAITLWRDPGRTADELRAISPADADAYVGFDREVRTMARFLERLARVTPPDPKSRSFADAVAGFQLAAAFRRLPRDDARALLRVLAMPVADHVSEWFADDSLRALVASRGIRYASLGPRAPGTAQLLLADATGGADAGAAGHAVFALGGPGAVADALATAVRESRGEIRTNAEVVAIRSHDGRVRGVALATGEEIEAGVVASGLDPKRTLLGLTDPVALGSSLAWRVGNLHLRGAVAKVNLSLSGLPAFHGSDGEDGERRLRGRIVMAGGLDGIERAADAWKYGRVSDVPYLEATIPSLVDPTLVDPHRARGVRHVMSVLVQYAPYELRYGDWRAERDRLGDVVLRTLETYAPGTAALVVDRQVVTPLDLEREYGLTEGHPLHGEQGLDQIFAWRPLLGHARYRMPIDGLYLCGSGAHPGGGVTGGPGANAAREILADLRSRRR